MKFVRWLILSVLFCCSCRSQQHSTIQTQSNPMTAFVDGYFDALFEWSPTAATSIGFHQYDSKIEDRSLAAIQRRIDKLKQLESELATARAGNLTVDEDIDAEILNGQIKAELLDIETLQTWRKNPMNYVGLPGSAIDGLMKR